MTCRDFRQLADALAGEGLTVERSEMARRHLATCAGCRAELEMGQALRDSLQTAFGRARSLAARPEFVTRLTAELRAEARSRRRSTPWRWVPAALFAAAALCVLAIGLDTPDRLAARRWNALTDEAVGDHETCVVKFGLTHHPMSLEDAGRRFSGFYGALSNLTPSVAESDGDAMTVVERHACRYHGRRFAHIVVRYRGTLGSLLVTASPDVAARDSEMRHIGGLNVVTFATAHHAVFVVCPLGEPDSRELADALEEPVRQALTGF